MKVIKKDLASKLANRMNCSKQISELMVDNLFDIIFEEVTKGNRVILPQLGVIFPILYKTGKVGNLHGQGTVMVPDKLKLKLVASKMMKAKLEELRKEQAIENTTFFLM